MAATNDKDAMVSVEGFDPRLCVTCSAPTNIAVIKYWGKDSKELNTAINSSASVTLCQDDLKAITTVAASKSFSRDRLWLNGTEEDVAGNRRFQAVITQVKALASNRVDEMTGEVLVEASDWGLYKVHIASRNTFPTAAGLASSAAGLACLTFALAQLFNARESFPGELTAIARQGSGSACRSLYGGFVKWVKGVRPDARDSIAVQVADEEHWPELRAVILVVSADKKHTSSTVGMDMSVTTSPLLAFRAREVVEPRLQEMEAAYLRRDFAAFGRLTMMDSNQFHATCLDTYPPIFYMNDISRAVVRAVHAYNDYHGEIRAAYTFDAGPNAVIYTLESTVPELLAVMAHLFLPDTALSGNAGRFHDIEGAPDVLVAAAEATLPAPLLAAAAEASGMGAGAGAASGQGLVKKVYCTSVGDGPRVLSPAECMLDPATGLPNRAAAAAGGGGGEGCIPGGLATKGVMLAGVLLLAVSIAAGSTCALAKKAR